jgi:hypothetical protein
VNLWVKTLRSKSGNFPTGDSKGHPGYSSPMDRCVKLNVSVGKQNTYKHLGVNFIVEVEALYLAHINLLAF